MPEQLSEHDAYILTLLVNGWIAEHTVKGEFRINNGPPEDMAIIERLIDAGLVLKSSSRAYIAADSPWASLYGGP